MKRKPIPKQIRLQVYNKCNGHCAYCGCELEYNDMQVDHIDSVYVAEMQGRKVNDTVDNYMPACRMCNYYKSSSTLEQFRTNLTELLMPNVRRPFDYRLAVKYGLVVETVKPVKFYFEEHAYKFRVGQLVGPKDSDSFKPYRVASIKPNFIYGETAYLDCDGTYSTESQLVALEE